MRDRLLTGLVAAASLVAWLYLTAPHPAAPASPALPSQSVAAVAAPFAAPMPAAIFDATTAFQFKLVGCWAEGTHTVFANDQVVLFAQLPGAACLNTRRTSFER